MLRPGRAREWLGRLGLIGFGLALALLLLELALQLGAWGVSFTQRSHGGARQPDVLRVLCVGDSNTYGLHLAPEQAYPAQLERELTVLSPERRVEVLNLGVPGLNSSRLLREFPELLEALTPDWVIVLIGVNDMWTDPSAEAVAPPTTPSGWLKRNSRVLRLARLLRARGAADVEVDVSQQLQQENPFVGADSWVRIGDREFDFGYARAAAPPPPAEAAVRLDANLHALRALAEGAGARVLFMTYPAHDELYRRANPLIRASAHKGLPLLDLTQIFRDACPLSKCPALLFEDEHPTADGYRLMAQKIATWMQTQR